MEALRKFILQLVGIVVSVITMIAVMIKGWGLKPVNWWWIIGVYVFGTFIAAVLMALTYVD